MSTVEFNRVISSGGCVRALTEQLPPGGWGQTCTFKSLLIWLNTLPLYRSGLMNIGSNFTPVFKWVIVTFFKTQHSEN